VVTVRELFATRESVYRGRRVRLMWPTRAVPVYLTAEGPRTLELAGEVADGVIVGTGLQREVVEDSLAHLARGAARSGRSLEDLDVWWFIKWNLDDDKRRAIAEMRMTLTASANHAFRFTLEGKHIPEEYKEPIRRLQAQYRFEEHESHGADRRNAQLVEESGLTDYLAERFTLAGSPGEFRQKLAGLQSLGVNNFLMAFFGESDPDGKHERLAAEVMA
jgi:5,10-methylenetetrahydromethanopterin reductase